MEGITFKQVLFAFQVRFSLGSFCSTVLTDLHIQVFGECVIRLVCHWMKFTFLVVFHNVREIPLVFRCVIIVSIVGAIIPCTVDCHAVSCPCIGPSRLLSHV